MKARGNNLKVWMEQYAELVRDLIDSGVFERIFRECFSSVFDRDEWSNTLLAVTPKELTDKLYPADGMYLWVSLNEGNTVLVKGSSPHEATCDLENGTIHNWPYAKVEIRNPVDQLYLLLAHQYGSWLSGKVRCGPGELHLLNDYVDCVKSILTDKKIRESAKMLGGWTAHDEKSLDPRLRVRSRRLVQKPRVAGRRRAIL